MRGRVTMECAVFRQRPGLFALDGVEIFGDGSVGAEWEGVNLVYGCCDSRFWVVYCRM